MEAACRRALAFDDPSYKTIKRILVQGLEQEVPAGLLVIPAAITFARSAKELPPPGGGTAMELKHQLAEQLRNLRLSGVLETLEARNRQAIDNKWSYQEFLSRIPEDEVERRSQKQLQLRLRQGALNSTKTLEGFDFNFNANLNRQQTLNLAAGEYVRKKRNLLICGPTGVGKTHLAQALGQKAARQGFDVLFASVQKMLHNLNGGRADGSLDRRLSSYLWPDLLILDDFGLKAIPAPRPEDLYDVINDRYEHRSILFTSNRAPNEWADLFLDPLLGSAGLDRLLDRAEVVIISGPSYRSQGRKNLLEEAQTSAYDELIFPISPVLYNLASTKRWYVVAANHWYIHGRGLTPILDQP